MDRVLNMIEIRVQNALHFEGGKFMTRVRIIGNSTDSRRFYEFVKKVVENNGLRVELEWDDVTYSTAAVRYNVKKFPALEIDRKIISEGKYDYTEKELLRLIR